MATNALTGDDSIDVAWSMTGAVRMVYRYMLSTFYFCFTTKIQAVNRISTDIVISIGRPPGHRIR